MTKSELAQILAERNHISIKDAEMVVSLFFEMMSEALIEGQSIEIRGFGSFTIREYGSYTGRNPRTGELTHVKVKKLPFFKTGKELRERLNSGPVEDPGPEG